MYCPKCSVEFAEGVTTCSDCDIDLKPEPPPGPEAEFVYWVIALAHRDFGRIGLAESILQANGIDFVTQGATTRLAELNEPMRVCVRPEDEDRAKEALTELPSDE